MCDHLKKERSPADLKERIHGFYQDVHNSGYAFNQKGKGDLFSTIPMHSSHRKAVFGVTPRVNEEFNEKVKQLPTFRSKVVMSPSKHGQFLPELAEHIYSQS